MLLPPRRHIESRIVERRRDGRCDARGRPDAGASAGRALASPAALALTCAEPTGAGRNARAGHRLDGDAAGRRHPAIQARGPTADINDIRMKDAAADDRDHPAGGAAMVGGLRNDAPVSVIRRRVS